MKQQSIASKVAVDMFLVQSIWTAFFIGIYLLIRVVNIFIKGFLNGKEVTGFFNSVFFAGHLYMFIIGIFAIYFLPYFVGNGVTRKDYFKGAVVASFILSIMIPLVASIIALIEKLLLNVLNISFYQVQNLNDLDMEGNFVADIIMSFIISPQIEFEINWLLSIALFIINLFTAYMVGWLIGASFYRFGTIIGLLTIVFAVFLKILTNSLLRITLDLPVLQYFSILNNLSPIVALLGIIIIITISISIIRVLTKRVAVKM